MEGWKSAMLKIEHTEVYGWEPAIRGMRNPMNSWDKSDSYFSCENCQGCYYECEAQKREIPGMVDIWCDHTALRIGTNDHDLMMRLAAGGAVHAKYRRMITVYCDITAPLYWWKEFDTYKVGTVANSCSTMHKIHAKEFTLDDFSWEQLLNTGCDLFDVETDKGLFKRTVQPLEFLCDYIIPVLNTCREKYLKTKDKDYWWQMIQLLPTSYNQKRTIMMNYEVLVGMYRDRRNHKLDEWHTLCDWIRELPYSEIITGGEVG